MKTSFEFAKIAATSSVLRILSKDIARNHVIRRFSEIPGVPAKVSQLMGIRSNGDISTDIKTIPKSSVYKMLCENFSDLRNKIIEIHQGTPASLSQVHKVTFLDGRVVAIKIQYPDLKTIMNEQLDLSFQLFNKFCPARAFDWDAKSFESYFKESLFAELDYVGEAQRQIEFKNKVKALNVMIPGVIGEYSNSNILSQDFLAATQFSQIVSWRDDLKSKIIQKLINFQIDCLFLTGMIHGDLHPGNWGVDKESMRLVFYDFGSVLRVNPHQLEALLNLLSAVELGRGTEFDYLNVYETIGFDRKKLENISQQLPTISKAIFGIFTGEQDSLEKTQDKLGTELSSLVGGNIWWFRFAGPPWFMAFMRSWMGVLMTAKEANVKVRYDRWKHYLKMKKKHAV